MSDLIRRKDALAYPLSWEHYDMENGDVKFMCGVESYREYIESLPSAQQWIPCSERLPEEYGEYQITWTTSAYGERFIGDSEYEITMEWDYENDRFKGEWLLPDYIKDHSDVKVIAWMPLPEPYKGKADGPIR